MRLIFVSFKAVPNLCRAFALFGKQGTEQIHQRIVSAI
jgi:hypothetical protein